MDDEEKELFKQFLLRCDEIRKSDTLNPIQQCDQMFEAVLAEYPPEMRDEIANLPTVQETWIDCKRRVCMAVVHSNFMECMFQTMQQRE